MDLVEYTVIITFGDAYVHLICWVFIYCQAKVGDT